MLKFEKNTSRMIILLPFTNQILHDANYLGEYLYFRCTIIKKHDAI